MQIFCNYCRDWLMSSSKDLISAKGFCAPDRLVNHESYGSCLTLQELQSVAALYNRNVKNAKDKIPKSKFRSSSGLVKALNEKLKPNCKGNEDHCWLDQPYVKSSPLYHKLKQNFRPEKPASWNRNEREWLNTLDIMDVMKQYERMDKTFKFLGVFPIDFAQETSPGVCIVQEMCKFDIRNLISNGFIHCGIVFNLDKHNQPGSHWVATYINVNPESPKFGLCYYDSAGIRPKPMILDWLKTVKSQMVDYFPPDIAKRIVTKYNHEQHQFQNTECGVFSMLFIICCMENQYEPYRDTKQRISKKKDRGDKSIHDYRAKLWTPPKSSRQSKNSS